MSETLFEPKFKNKYTHIVVIDDGMESSRFDDFLDYYELEYDMII
jgi:hypothetical protein